MKVIINNFHHSLGMKVVHKLKWIWVGGGGGRNSEHYSVTLNSISIRKNNRMGDYYLRGLYSSQACFVVTIQV